MKVTLLKKLNSKSFLEVRSEIIEVMQEIENLRKAYDIDDPKN